MKKLVKMIKNNSGRIITMLVMVMFMAVSAFATGTTTTTGGLNADPALFNTMMKFIAQWTAYLGIGMAFFGAVQLAMGFRSDDAEGKNKGMRSMMAGLIVVAVGLAVMQIINITIPNEIKNVQPTN